MKYCISALLTSLLFPLLLHSQQFSTTSRSAEALAFYETGEREAKVDDLSAAKSAYLQAIANDPRFVDALDHLADVYRNTGQVDSAIFYYRQSLDYYPRGIRAHQNLAAAYQLAGDFVAATNQYRELLAHYPDYPHAYYGMALVYFNQENFQEAIVNSEKAMRIFLGGNSNLKAAEARMLAGQAYLGAGEFNKALKYFKASKKHFDSKPYYYYYVGMAYLKMGKKDKAMENLAIAENLGYRLPEQVKWQIR